MANLNRGPRSSSGFDRVARLYRAMEYLSFGPMLERCRFAHIPALAQARQALVLGDGDGRFLARLLTANRELHAHAVDASPAMLGLLRSRIARSGAQARLTATCADARTFRLAVVPDQPELDLVVTHFFLDCLTPDEARDLIARIHPHLAPGATWLVSEFQAAEQSRIRAAFSRGIISGLYAAFRLLTGLTVREIPPWRDLLAQAGFAPRARRTFLGGLLVSELWTLQTTVSDAAHSHEEVINLSDFASTSGPSFSSIPGIDPGPEPNPGLPPEPRPEPAPEPAPEPDPMPYPGPIPAPQPVTRAPFTEFRA